MRSIIEPRRSLVLCRSLSLHGPRRRVARVRSGPECDQENHDQEHEGASRDLYGRNAYGPDRTDEGGIEIKGLPDESFAYTIQRKLA